MQKSSVPSNPTWLLQVSEPLGSFRSSHQITEWVGGTLKAISFHSPTMGRDIFHSLPQAPFNLALNASKDSAIPNAYSASATCTKKKKSLEGPEGMRRHTPKIQREDGERGLMFLYNKQPFECSWSQGLPYTALPDSAKWQLCLSQSVTKQSIGPDGEPKKQKRHVKVLGSFLGEVHGESVFLFVCFSSYCSSWVTAFKEKRKRGGELKKSTRFQSLHKCGQMTRPKLCVCIFPQHASVCCFTLVNT